MPLAHHLTALQARGILVVDLFKLAAAASTPDGEHLEVLDPELQDRESPALLEGMDGVSVCEANLAADGFQSALARVKAHGRQARAAIQRHRLVAALLRGPRSARRRGSVLDNLDVVLRARPAGD